MGNKIATLGYFKKRMRDSGYLLNDFYVNYSLMDARCWTVIIDPGVSNIFCTLYNHVSKEGVKNTLYCDYYFELHDGGQFLPSRFCIKTDSIEIIIETLVKHNINRKSDTYEQSRTRENDK